MAVELASAYISLIPSAKGMGANIAKEISGPAEAAGQQAGKQMAGGMSSSIKQAAGTIGVGLGAGAAVAFLGGTVSAASDLNETISKTRTVFGPAAASIEKWAATAASAMGQSKQQALDAAGSFGNMFVQLGIGSDRASDMSMQMTQLASDFASFHNADISEVLVAQQAAFRGEYDALQRFVPTINAAAVEQEALRATGKKTTKELTLQEKALATQALMMKGAGDATGDFARTSGGLANKQRIQAAQWADMKAKIGSGLLPVMTTLTSLLTTKVLPIMEKLGNFISDNKSLFVALAVGITAVLVPAFVAWAAAAIPAAAATIAAAAPVIALGAAVAALAYLVIKNWDTIKAAIGTAVDFVKGLITGLIDVFRQIPGWIKTAFSMVAKIITAPYRAAFKLIAKLWNNTLGKISFKIPGWVPGIGGKGFSFPKISEDLPTLHDGGIVPGRRGTDVLARLQAGETVLPIGAGAGGLQMPMHFHNEGVKDEHTLADLIGRQVGWRLSTAGLR